MSKRDELQTRFYPVLVPSLSALESVAIDEEHRHALGREGVTALIESAGRDTTVAVDTEEEENSSTEGERRWQGGRFRARRSTLHYQGSGAQAVKDELSREVLCGEKKKVKKLSSFRPMVSKLYLCHARQLIRRPCTPFPIL